MDNSNSSYEDTKGNEKCRNLGGFGGLWVTEGHQQHNPVIERIKLRI